MADTPRKSGSDLFIVDNSDTDWKVARYLHQWAEIAHTIDIATGYFEIGALLALDGQWQKLDKIRLLMGDEVSKKTKKAFEAGLKNITARLDDSLEAAKEENDFLAGVPAIVEAIKCGKIEARVYRKEKFHAKAYITHPKLDVIGSAALVGGGEPSRTLTEEDIAHYQRIVVALNETIRLMAEIDEVIEAHGGWPLVGSVREE